MGHYVTNIHEEGQEIVVRKYYVNSFKEAVDANTYEGVMAKRHFKERFQNELNKKATIDCPKKTKEKKENNRTNKTKQELETEIEKKKRRQIRNLTKIMNSNFSCKAISVVLTFSSEYSLDDLSYSFIKTEVEKFIKRINLRISNNLHYIYSLSRKDISYEHGRRIVKDARPHIHMILESEDFKINGNDIIIHTKNGNNISFESAWGQGIDFVKSIKPAIDDYSNGQLDYDQIMYFKEKNTPADFMSFSNYIVDQAVESYGYNHRAWNSSVGLLNPGKGLTIDDCYDNNVRIPKGLILQSEREYGEKLRYKEARYYKTSNIQIDDILEANPRFCK